MQYRNIVPEPSSRSDKGSLSDSPTADGPPSRGAGPWKKRVSTACLACKKSKRKCSGVAPCDNCRTFNRVCIFDESLDQRRRVAAKRTADELNYHRDLLNDLFKVMRSRDPSHVQRLLDLVRSDATSDDIRTYIDDTLAGMKVAEPDNQEAVRKLEDLRHLIQIEGANPSFRRKVMDIHYLCNDAPIKVPAKPWTTVTDDDGLVSHLVSLYFTWDYPFHCFMDGSVFIKHMAIGKTDSPFCNPFLVNALLANACHFSEFSEAYAIPGDVMTKGTDFLAEAERCLSEIDNTNKLDLASVQGTLLLYERYSMFGNDDYGYMMLHRAVKMAENLGLVNNGDCNNLLDLPHDLQYSMKRTAWGLYHIDTVAHTSFLRASLVRKVNIARVPRDENTENDMWRPYPTHRAARPSWLSQYMDEACSLCHIARDISHDLFAEADGVGPEMSREQRRDELYDQLQRWERELPGIFGTDRKPAAHILLLRMRYHALVVNLFTACQNDEISETGSETSVGQRQASPKSRPPASEVKKIAALEIASLTRLHRSEYGITRAHTFAMYAINLALFALLDREDFDILDRDFLALASAFTIIASRSSVGRSLFHIFRQSVRSKCQGKRIRESNALPDELKELFDEESSLKGSTRWDDYAEGLHKLLQSERYRGLGIEDDQRGLQEYSGLGLYDMLDRYESLSLGKDEFLSERQK